MMERSPPTGFEQPTLGVPAGYSSPDRSVRWPSTPQLQTNTRHVRCLPPDPPAKNDVDHDRPSEPSTASSNCRAISDSQYIIRMDCFLLLDMTITIGRTVLKGACYCFNWQSVATTTGAAAFIEPIVRCHEQRLVPSQHHGVDCRGWQHRHV